jgi:prepilin peptidase CpaA
MGAEILVIVVLPVLLALAAGWDLASFTIPNLLSAAVAAAFILFLAMVPLGASAIAWHVAAGFAGLIVGFAFFALGYIGGGDAKLFAAVTLWLGFHDLAAYALAASLLGGLLTLAILALRQYPLPALAARQAWIIRLHAEKSGIPYGVALAAGAFVLLPHTEIFRLAAGALSAH